jgi:PAS domain S-box-containing protein
MNQNLFQSLVEMTSDAVFIVRVMAEGKEFVMEYVNDAYLQKFGVTRESVINKEFRDMLDKDIVIPIRERFSFCAKQQTRVQFEEHFGNGTTSLSELFPIIGPDQQTNYIVGISKDITELKRKRDQLAESEHTLQSIINSSDNVLIYVDLEQRVIYANKKAQDHAMRMFGKPFVIGEHVYANYPEEARQQGNQHLSALIQEKHTIAFEHEFTYPDGEKRWYFRRYYPVIDSDEQITGVVIASINITERKRHELEVQKHATKMREIAKIQSHQIRRPLANIMGLTDLFDMQGKSIEENEQILNYLRISAQELDQLITHIVHKTQDE